MKAYAKGAFLCVALATLVACGGDTKKDDAGKSDSGKKEPATAPGAADKAYDAAAHTGAVSGSVKLDGAAPAPVALAVSSDAFCDGKWQGKTMFDPAFTVNADGTVPNAFVYAADGPHKDYSGFSAPAGFEVVQKDCQYVPYVFGVMEGQEFLVSNPDGTTHNVNVKPKRSPSMNKAQATGDKDTFVFKKKEKAIPFTCDVHSWMSAFAWCMEHPFFTTTDAAGKFEIKGLPDGEYTFKVWHPSFAPEKKEHSFTVTIAGGAVTQEVTLPAQ